jgi:hypothetical protein
MPYIKQDKRDVLDPAIETLCQMLANLDLGDANNMEGNINYIFTKVLRTFYGESYADINSAMGILNSVTHEYYRIAAAPYENQKQFENGDVEVAKPSVDQSQKLYNDSE